jgi:hypothetical protein
MQANSDGLSPSLRPFLGIGWNRALPAPFGFGNGLVPDGSNDYLKIPGLVGKTWPLEGCIEFWCSVQGSRAQREVEIQFNDGSNLRITAYATSFPVIQSAARMPGSSAGPNGIYSYSTKYHYCFMWDSSKLYAWGNAVLPNVFTSTSITSNINLQIVGASIAGQVDGTLCTTSMLDEVRFYNRKLLLDELVLNDNNGVGNNPSTTENLFAWYAFENFETLDFSALQDGSDLRIGIRDYSGQNNHAQQFNMNTNPLSPTYSLQPF